MTTGEMMSKNVVTIDSRASALEAVGLMLKHKVRHLPVIRKGQVMGILSVDQIQAIEGSFEKVTVGDICDKFVVYASPDSSLSEISNAFRRLKLQALPVLNRFGHVVGIITLIDFLKLMPSVRQAPQSA